MRRFRASISVLEFQSLMGFMPRVRGRYDAQTILKRRDRARHLLLYWWGRGLQEEAWRVGNEDGQPTYHWQEHPEMSPHYPGGVIQL